MTLDAAGNLHGLYPGADGAACKLLIGSHLDTVPDAGAYDGILGVMLAISVVESLGGRRLPFAIEVVGFSEEEGVRFGVPFIGSRALVGRLDEELLSRRDSDGISVQEAILSYELKPSEIPAARLSQGVLGYLEFHIEQGPVLENRGFPLGIVEAIAGQTRMELVFTGVANHAGTTPMESRRDALVAAAEWTVAVEKSARDIPGLVATVGALNAKPGATNVIAGQCCATLDIRHASDATRTQSVSAFLHSATEIAKRRGISLTSSTKLVQTATPMDSLFLHEIDAAVSQSGITPYRMISGAGHDAMVLAEKVPAAMVFLRSPGGISHNSRESVLVEDVAKAIECGFHLLNQLAVSPEFQMRANRA
ncbi:MAG: amidase, hydantoinase/carbamoylase family [Candidatus Acidoferrum typicum]|nr:amidase, hydantoinase/carbamoylase family [Candidatus Acidoferrum typicum]